MKEVMEICVISMQNISSGNKTESAGLRVCSEKAVWFFSFFPSSLVTV